MSPLFKKGISPAQILLRRLGVNPDLLWTPEFLAMVEAKVAISNASKDSAEVPTLIEKKGGAA